MARKLRTYTGIGDVPLAVTVRAASAREARDLIEAVRNLPALLVPIDGGKPARVVGVEIHPAAAGEYDLSCEDGAVEEEDDDEGA